ncbi:MAG: acyl-CoA dehydrogenase family protein [Saprospiraceae bacterium]|nr:acyl-CoA dehydrogenase family protein [Saprospiraceae bacterium]
METTIEKKAVLKGGEFLVKESTAHDIFTREDLTEEQLMFGDATKQFVDSRILPNAEDIEELKEGLTPSLLEELGELGVLGAGLPMEFNGQGLDFITDTVLSEEIGKSGSFGVSVAAHTGIGTLPIYYYGTEAQKAKYLPGLATGQLKAAYCLTEPSSGSDALGAKSTAVLDGDEWVINGQKMWITNGGFADIFIVFAQVDGDKFTGFIVPGDLDGITRNAEEKKLGIKGSSTRQIFFENVRVPKDYVLGEIGKGHKIAFNVLNIGRYKLCAMVMGGAKRAIGVSANYTNERKQFGKNLHEFGAIKHKLAEMAIKTFATDSATYRTAGYINDLIQQLLEEGKTPAEAKLIAAEEYSIECALLKVLGSETLDYVVDENVQIHGGMGYSEEGHAARAYRDSRINRIFEGTNEINRLLSIGMMMKKGMKGEIDLLGPAMAVGKELMSVPSFGSGPEGFFAKEKQAIVNAKKAGLLVAGAAAQKFMQHLEEQQEIMMYLSDMLIDVFAAESTLLRVEKMVAAKGEEACALEIDMARTYLVDALDRINSNGRSAVAGFAEGDEMRMMLMGLKRFTKFEPVNTIAARRRIADHIVEQNAYTF